MRVLPSGKMKKVPDPFTIVAVGNISTTFVEIEGEMTGIQFVRMAVLTTDVVQTSLVLPAHGPVERTVVLYKKRED
jgi:hypothetical protein